MTIGPEPIRQIDSMSRRLGKAAHLLDPAIDQAPRVVRARARLRMELDGARPQLGILEPLDGLVVERDVRRLASLARAHGEPVVLAGHEYAPGLALDHGVVRAAVAERELERLVPGRKREQLVAEADPENRDTSNQATDCCNLIWE